MLHSLRKGLRHRGKCWLLLMATFIIIFNLCNSFFWNWNNLISCCHFVMITWANWREKLTYCWLAHAAVVELKKTMTTQRKQYDKMGNTTTRRKQYKDAKRREWQYEQSITTQPRKQHHEKTKSMTRRRDFDEHRTFRRHKILVPNEMPYVLNLMCQKFTRFESSCKWGVDALKLNRLKYLGHSGCHGSTVHWKYLSSREIPKCQRN